MALIDCKPRNRYVCGCGTFLKGGRRSENSAGYNGSDYRTRQVLPYCYVYGRTLLKAAVFCSSPKLKNDSTIGFFHGHTILRILTTVGLWNSDHILLAQSDRPSIKANRRTEGRLKCWACNLSAKCSVGLCAMVHGSHEHHGMERLLGL